MIKAVLFDSDGTLMDSFSIIVSAYAYLAERYGYPTPTVQDIQAQLSQSYPLYQIMATFFPGADTTELMRVNGEYIADHIAETAAYAGLHDLLQELHEQGIRLGLVTGGNHRVHDVLHHHDIAHYFTSVVHCERVERSKPDPEGVLLALQECAVHPKEAIMVGDSPADIFAGKNAGVHTTIGVTHGHGSARDLQAADADVTVGSLVELRDRLRSVIV